MQGASCEAVAVKRRFQRRAIASFFPNVLSAAMAGMCCGLWRAVPAAQ